MDSNSNQNSPVQQDVLRVNDLIQQQDNSRTIEQIPRVGGGHSRTQTQFNTIDVKIMKEGGPGSGAGRFRMRSRTPNTNQTGTNRPTSVQRARLGALDGMPGGRISNQGGSTIQNDYDSITASNYGARSHRKFVKRGQSAKRGHSKSSLIGRTSTVESTITYKYNNAPGPGSYMTGAQFPKGPSYHIQQKSKQDSMFLTKIAQNISPGPAKYLGHSSGIGGTSQSIATKLNQGGVLTNASSYQAVGPGAYETNSTSNLNQGPRATIGNSNNQKSTDQIPGPDKYMTHKPMTKFRLNSAERNAPRATFGHENRLTERVSKSRMTTMEAVAHNTYNHMSMKSIGDESSVKVPFTTAIRPISAKPGQIKPMIHPGPQDYRTVSTATYMKRSSVIPTFKFTTAGQDLQSAAKIQERSKSPGPSCYRPQSAALSLHKPSAIIGNTKRQLMNPTDEVASNPGPSDYKIQRSIGNGPTYHIAIKYKNLLQKQQVPGPSDYQVDFIKHQLKRQTRVTIGNAKKVSCLVPRELSPGPQCYVPEKLALKKRHPTVIFNRELRSGIYKDQGHITPGPGSYFRTQVPQKFVRKSKSPARY